MGSRYPQNERKVAESGLPQPLYYYESSGFWVVFRKDVINEEELRAKGLNDRQIKAVLYVKEKGRITNSEYQKLNSTISKTALRDLDDLINRNIFTRSGEGRNVYYKISMS